MEIRFAPKNGKSDLALAMVREAWLRHMVLKREEQKGEDDEKGI